MTFYPRFAVLVLAMGLLAIPASLRRLDGVGRVIVAVPGDRAGGAVRRPADPALPLVRPGGGGLQRDHPEGATGRADRGAGVRPHLAGDADRVGAGGSAPPVPGAAPRRAASMTPVFYCGMRHMPCKRLPAKAAIPDPGPWGPHLFTAGEPAPTSSTTCWSACRRGGRCSAPPTTGIELLAKEGSWLAYKVHRPAPTRPPAPKPAAAPAAAHRRGLPGQRVKGARAAAVEGARRPPGRAGDEDTRSQGPVSRVKTAAWSERCCPGDSDGAAARRQRGRAATPATRPRSAPTRRGWTPPDRPGPSRTPGSRPAARRCPRGWPHLGGCWTIGHLTGAQLQQLQPRPQPAHGRALVRVQPARALPARPSCG